VLSVGWCAVCKSVCCLGNSTNLPGDGIVYWPKQMGTVREMSWNYLRNVGVHSENCQVIIRELSEY
jgi:hypothetical protein